jgi:hypothetical protein
VSDDRPEIAVLPLPNGNFMIIASCATQEQVRVIAENAPKFTRAGAECVLVFDFPVRVVAWAPRLNGKGIR